MQNKRRKQTKADFFLTIPCGNYIITITGSYIMIAMNGILCVMAALTTCKKN
jgi:hypothetical protein